MDDPEKLSEVSSKSTTQYHETNFHAPVTGHIHTGSGNIYNSSNPISLFALKSWFNSVFQWSEAPLHMRSSWAGMIIWSFSAFFGRFTASDWLRLFIAVALWIAAATFITPILQWPMTSLPLRLIASVQFAISATVIPTVIALCTVADNQADFSLTTKKMHLILFILKWTGALVGFGVFTTLLLCLALIRYYLNIPFPQIWGWYFLLLIPLLFSHIAARRIPTDRIQMFEGKLQLHQADKLFLIVFFLWNFLIAWGVYKLYHLLAYKTFGISFLVALILVAWYEQRKQAKR